MLPRVLEPEVMDSEEEAREYDTMDHSEVNRRFASDFLAVHRGGWKILDVGTGTALIPIELCRQEPRAIVLAIDAAEHMLHRSAENVAGAGLVGRIHLELMDAKTLPYSDRSFPAVISNSIVHHIEPPRRVLAEMVRVLAPGGTLFVRDLLRPPDAATLGHLVKTYAGEATERQRALFEASLQAALTLAEVRDMVRDLDPAPEGVAQTSDRHWTWVFQPGGE
ncbi:MAG: class I SAM-dependent methyltransferase [Planctomycetes bacterium]|nr:class I SAM-dependent methyltransferase [Planctomycetota bacterium]